MWAWPSAVCERGKGGSEEPLPAIETTRTLPSPSSQCKNEAPRIDGQEVGQAGLWEAI